MTFTKSEQNFSEEFKPFQTESNQNKKGSKSKLNHTILSNGGILLFDGETEQLSYLDILDNLQTAWDI